MNKLELTANAIVRRKLTSVFGDLYVRANATHLLSISFIEDGDVDASEGAEQSTNRNANSNPNGNANRIIDAFAGQLEEYCRGERINFDLPLGLTGTAFQQKAWQALMEIPYGSTISYSEQAARIGHPQATRAVGRANGKNSFPLVIPCHRVIAASGGLGGYAGGLEFKQRLMAHEEHFKFANAKQ